MGFDSKNFDLTRAAHDIASLYAAKVVPDAKANTNPNAYDMNTVSDTLRMYIKVYSEVMSQQSKLSDLSD